MEGKKLTVEELAEAFNGLAVRSLVLERTVAVIFKTLRDLVLQKKLMTEEEFDSFVQQVAKEVDDAFQEFLEDLRDVAAAKNSPKN